MTKDQAIWLLGGSARAAARKLKVSYQAVCKWPNVLPRRIEDRVIASLARDRTDIDELVAAQLSHAVQAQEKGEHV